MLAIKTTPPWNELTHLASMSSSLQTKKSSVTTPKATKPTYTEGTEREEDARKAPNPEARNMIRGGTKRARQRSNKDEPGIDR